MVFDLLLARGVAQVVIVYCGDIAMFKMKLLVGMVLCASVFGQRRVALGDWPEQRGPNRDGASKETGLPEKWSPSGENLLWRAPYGGRSAPVVIGNRVCVQNP